MSFLKVCFLAVFFTLLNAQAFSFSEDYQANDLVLIAPTGELHKDYPVMELISDTTVLFKNLHYAFKISFLKQALNLYSFSQVYAWNLELVDHPEPAYLAITKNQGGFAKKGFYLRNGDKVIDKTNSHYIDITENAASGDLKRLMSLTQLYPHELGHVLYHLFSKEDSIAYNNRSVDMHYFSVRTDFPTAFNEGFAEHMENIARLEEKNDSIKSGIKEDLNKTEKLTAFTKNKFKRDLRIPLRFGFYKATMINWFQKYEDYKRYKHALDGTIKYRGFSPDYRNPEDRITYRNTALEWDTTKVRNKVQAHSTEGMISAFFSMLSLSELGSSYRDHSFYSAFRLESPERVLAIEESISPLDNMFMKYFYVFHHFMVENHSQSSQLNDFIAGYIASFPDESKVLLDIYQQVFGEEYSPSMPPPVWILVNNYQHRLLTLDAYGAITIPLYTFDLNGAEVEDLLTIDGLSENHAATIINYREDKGFFRDLQDLKNIPGIDSGAYQTILQSSFEQSLFESEVEAYDSSIHIGTLFLKPLLDLGLKILIYLLLFYFAYYTWIQSSRKKSILRWILLFIGHYCFWFLVVLLTLFSIFAIPNPIPLIVIFHGLLIFFSYLIFKKRIKDRRFILSMQFFFFIVIVLSII